MKRILTCLFVLFLMSCGKSSQEKIRELCDCEIEKLAYLTDDRIIITRKSDSRSNIYNKKSNHFVFLNWYDVSYYEHDDFIDVERSDVTFYMDTLDIWGDKIKIDIPNPKLKYLNESVLTDLYIENRKEYQKRLDKYDATDSHVGYEKNLSEYITTTSFKLGDGFVTFMKQTNTTGTISISGNGTSLSGNYLVYDDFEIQITNLRAISGYYGTSNNGSSYGYLVKTSDNKLEGRIYDTNGNYRDIEVYVIK